MRLKLEFMLPNVKAAHHACEQMLLARINDQYIHFLARPHTDLGNLQLANTIEKTNFINEGAKGVLTGATIGLLVGLYMHYFQPWITTSMNVNWLVILAITTAFGAAVSAIGAAVFGVNLLNTDLAIYKDRIDKGEILMIVSVPMHRAKQIRALMRHINTQRLSNVAG